MSLSSITLSGTLKKDPEKRFTPTNIPVANLILEVCYIPRGSSQQLDNIGTQVVRVNAWRDLANECEQKLKTGDKVLVIGRAQINAYTNNEGKKKRELEIDATSVVLLNEVLSVRSSVKNETNEIHNREQTSDFNEVISNTEEIPF